MTKLFLTASLVLYKPDLQVLENALSEMQKAVQSAKHVHSLRFELTLVDNSNEASWHERLQIWVRDHAGTLQDLTLSLLNAHSNLGYGYGNNLVIEQVQSDYHIVLNPDLFIESNALTLAINYMQDHPDVGLLIPAVYGEDGERHYLCKRNPTLFIMFLRSFAPAWLQSCFKLTLANYEMRDCDYDEPIDPVPFPSGCFMFFRTRLLKQLNGFDPDYFLYFEDADIGRRMIEIARVVYVPSVRVVHQWARGTHNDMRLRMATIWSALIYWKKWGSFF